MKLLSLEDTLTAAQEAGVPGIDDLLRQVESLAEAVAESLAQHLNISCRNTSFWDGKLYTTFLPSQPGQKCPPVIDSGDPSGEWEEDRNCDEEGEASPMSMAG